MKHKLLIWLCFIAIISLYNCNIIFQVQAIDKTILQGPFKTNLFPNSKVYFQKSNDINKPVNFVLEYQKNGKIIKNIIDKYDVNGGDPEIVSVFFDKIHNKKYILTIIKWRDYHAALQMNGYDYQIYAYTINKSNKLEIDKKISNDPNFFGSDGSYDGKDMVFKYKTAAEVKKYLKHKYQ